jgi:hypothetical protein
MEAMPQAMEILFNEAMLIERSQHLGKYLKSVHVEFTEKKLQYRLAYGDSLFCQYCEIIL